MNDRFHVFTGAVRRRVHMGEKGHCRHAGFARVGRDAGQHITVPGHLHVRRTEFTQLLLQHLEQNQLT